MDNICECHCWFQHNLCYLIKLGQSLSKATKMFEDDERFEAVERARDREDLFENYLLELEKKVNYMASYFKAILFLSSLNCCWE